MFLDDAFQSLRQDILEDLTNESELQNYEKSDWTSNESFNKEEDFSSLFSLDSDKQVVKKRKTQDPNTNLTSENKRIIDPESLFYIIEYILSNKNETTYIIEHIDMIIQMCPSRV